MYLPLFISDRLKGAKGLPASSRTGMVIAVAGVALALAVMVVSLSVSKGFKDEIKRRVNGFEAAVSVLPAYDYMTGSQEVLMEKSAPIAQMAQEVCPEATLVETFRREAVLKTDSDFMAVQCLARSQAHNAEFDDEIIKSGRQPRSFDKDSVAISQVMASRLGLGLGDKLYLYFFVNDEVKARRAFVSGIYESNFGDFDGAVVFTPIAMLRSVVGDSTACTSIDLEGVAEQDIDRISSALEQRMVEYYRSGRSPEYYPVTDVHRGSGALYYNWLDLLDTNVVVIFILMACVAALTLVSSLCIVILDRVSTIGILRSIGASRATVSRVFVLLALRLVGAGVLIGDVIALGFILSQRLWHWMPLNPQMYYLDHVPVALDWWSIILINVGVCVGAWLILVLPARLASRIDPAQTVRFE